MKGWQLHLIFGNFLVIFWLAVLYFTKFQLSLPRIFILIFTTLFATSFPDIDLKISKFRDAIAISLAFFISIVYIYFFRDTWYYSPIYFVISYFLIKLIPTKHRGITHTVKFSLIFTIGILIVLNLFLKISQIENIFWFAVTFSSYNLHLFLDKF